MSAHWRLALHYSVWVTFGAALAAGAVWYYYGGAYAGALGYGVGAGVVSFVSTALSVSMLTGSSGFWRAVGAASFFLRYGFTAVALGVPAYLGLWPVVAMLAGFAGVYLAENVLLLPGVVRTVGQLPQQKPEQQAGQSEDLERRVAA